MQPLPASPRWPPHQAGKTPDGVTHALLEKEGHLVTREEIIDRLWGKDVFLDTEHGINTAVRKIRNALRDNPEQPRFVQTVTGKGYRFIASIDVISNERVNGNHQETEPVLTETTQAQPDPPVSSHLTQSHHRASGVVRKAALAVAGAIGVVAVAIVRSFYARELVVLGRTEVEPMRHLFS